MSWISGGYDRGPPDWDDQMQVCRNGHKITGMMKERPDNCQKFCSMCGAPTIAACEHCTAPIKGYRHISNVGYPDRTTPPKYCTSCGEIFPWQRAALDNLAAVLREGELGEESVSEIEAALPDILADTPRTQGAALKLQRLLPKLGKPVYDVAIKVITDVASETAKKTLGLG